MARRGKWGTIGTLAELPPRIGPLARFFSFRISLRNKNAVDSQNHSMVSIGRPLQNVPLYHGFIPAVSLQSDLAIPCTLDSRQKRTATELLPVLGHSATIRLYARRCLERRRKR